MTHLSAMKIEGIRSERKFPQLNVPWMLYNNWKLPNIKNWQKFKIPKLVIKIEHSRMKIFKEQFSFLSTRQNCSWKWALEALCYKMKYFCFFRLKEKWFSSKTNCKGKREKDVTVQALKLYLQKPGL